MTYQRTRNEFTSRSEDEMHASDEILQIMLNSMPDFGRKWDNHLPVFVSAPALARILWLDEVYRLALDIPGRVLEFGSQWAASLNIFMLLKMIHEPWNISRPIISFSTFEQGFVAVDAVDAQARLGDYATTEGWRAQLEKNLTTHAARSPVEAERNFDVIEGDVRETLPHWLASNPEALVSHAHFDMDVYEPTRDVLKMIIPRMPKGSVLIFDELNCPSFPGETLAVMEVLGAHNLALRKSRYQPYSAFCIIS